jgi:hypothetical protein
LKKFLLFCKKKYIFKYIYILEWKISFMLSKQGLALCLCVLACVCGNSFAQGLSGFAAQIIAKEDSLKRLDSLVKADSIARAAEAAALLPPPSSPISSVTPYAILPDSAALSAQAAADSVAKAEQAKKEQTKLDSVERVLAAERAAAAAKAKPIYPSYEIYLDSLDSYAKSLYPGMRTLDSLKLAVTTAPLAPKSEYETQAAFDSRVANYEKDKKQKVKALEKDYYTREKASIDKLVQAITIKDDIQPEWGGLLQKDSTIDGYLERINKFLTKINDMKIRTAQSDKLFAGLALSDGDSATIAKSRAEKNFLYTSRLQRACELMQDYILQEQSKVLSTERKKVDMTLGAYNVEKQEFELSMSDINSKTVPFNYSGKIKIPPAQAQVIDRKTDDFTVSLDYINFPFVVDSASLFPGVKKGYVFYKDQEFPHVGGFMNVPGFEKHPNYLDWALRADSMLSGKLLPRKLDSLYAMSKVKYKEPKAPSGPSWWTAPRVVRVIALTLSAASLGVGIWQNSEASSKEKDAKAIYDKAVKTKDESLKKSYNDAVSDKESAENLRNIFYISSGVLGSAGIVSFFF